MAENPLDAVIAAKLRSELSPEQVRLKTELEASIAQRQPAVDQDQRDVARWTAAREAPQPPMAEPAQAPTGPGWPRAALDMVNKGTSFMRGMGDMTDQGTMFGFADEAGAGIGAGVDKLLGRTDGSFADAYRENLAERQGTNQDFRTAHPVRLQLPRLPEPRQLRALVRQRRRRQDCQPLPGRSSAAELAAQRTAQVRASPAKEAKAQQSARAWAQVSELRVSA